MLHHLNSENKIGLTEVELNLISDLISGKPPKVQYLIFEAFLTAIF